MYNSLNNSDVSLPSSKDPEPVPPLRVSLLRKKTRPSAPSSSPTPSSPSRQSRSSLSY